MSIEVLNSQEVPTPSPEQGNGGVESQPTSQQQQSPSAATPGLPSDFYTDERFQKWQAKMDQRYAQLQKETQQREAALTARLREVETKDLNEVDKLRYALAERDSRLQQIEEYEKARQAAEAQAEIRRQDLKRISEGTEVPMSELEQAENYEHAWELVRAYKAKKSGQAQERTAANTPYIAQAQPSNPAVRESAEYAAAKAAGDGIAMLKMKLAGG